MGGGGGERRGGVRAGFEVLCPLSEETVYYIMNEKKGKIEKSAVNPKTLHRSVNLGGLQCRTRLS